MKKVSLRDYISIRLNLVKKKIKLKIISKESKGTIHMEFGMVVRSGREMQGE